MFNRVFMLTFITSVGAGSHSLMAFATYIIGQTPFPEFSAVVKLDDLQMMYYDSVSMQVVHRSSNDSTDFREEKSDAVLIFRDMHNDMKSRAFYLKNSLNHTGSVLVHQRLAGCELLSDSKPGGLRTWDAFNRQTKEEFIFNVENANFHIELPWMSWDRFHLLHMKFLYENIYHPVCLKILQSYLSLKKNNVMRKVKPRVRLYKKIIASSGDVQIICLATGFYPRHINLTIIRDQQRVESDQVSGGELLPNGDGTYQMRKSLVVSAHELHEGHEYKCKMDHLSLDNKLDIEFDVERSGLGASVAYGVSSVVVFSLTAFIIMAIIKWKMTKAGRVTCRQDYSTTPSTEPENT